MRTLLAITIWLFCLLPALAQERAGDAALGALSGAVLLGPVGAVAGAVVGYTAGPSIAQAWGLRQRPHHHRAVAKRRDRIVTGSATSTHPRSEPSTVPTPVGRPAELATVPAAQSFE
jgi:hypothetical protein